MSWLVAAAALGLSLSIVAAEWIGKMTLAKPVWMLTVMNDINYNTIIAEHFIYIYYSDTV